MPVILMVKNKGHLVTKAGGLETVEEYKAQGDRNRTVRSITISYLRDSRSYPLIESKAPMATSKAQGQAQKE